MIGGRRHQATGVGVPGSAQHLLGGPFLDDVAAVHHHDAVRDLRGDRQVVGDVEHRHVLFVAEPEQLVEDPGLGHHVEPGGGLVEDDDLRVRGQGGRDAHALLLAARQLVRIPASELLGSRAGRRGPASPARPRAGPRGLPAVTAHGVGDHVGHAQGRDSARCRDSAGHRTPRAADPRRTARRPDDLAVDRDVTGADRQVRRAVPERAQARSWSCRSPTRRPGRRSRRVEVHRDAVDDRWRPGAGPDAHAVQAQDGVAGAGHRQSTRPVELADVGVAHQVHADDEQGEHDRRDPGWPTGCSRSPPGSLRP